jgi:hypothetical protein
VSARRRLFLGAAAALSALAFPPLTAAAATAHKAPSTKAAEAGRWALAIALAFLIFGIPLIANLLRGLGRLFSKAKGPAPSLWWGKALVVGEDNRVSTSKTAALVWTYTLAAALLSFVIARWLGHPDGFKAVTSQGLNAQYALLVGGPLGAAILAKAIVSTQVANGSTAKPAASTPSPADLVQNDSGSADLGDLQYVLFNVVALIFFYGEMFRAPQLGVPTIPDVLLGLTSVSAVGFVGKKALAGPGGISAVDQEKAAVGEHVKIATAGIIEAEDDLRAVTVKFGSVPASPGSLGVTTTTSQGAIIEAVVPPDAAGLVEVTVSAPTSKPAIFADFKIVPKIGRGQHIVGSHGETVGVNVSGVAGLGQLVRASVDGHRSLTTVSGADVVHVTIPETAPIGETQLEIETPGGKDFAPIMVIEHPPLAAHPAAGNGVQPALASP